MKSKSIVLFDMDGVILDSAVSIVDSLTFALSSIGHVKESGVDLRQFVGPPLHEMANSLLPNESPEVKDLFAKSYRQHNNLHGPDVTLIFEGVQEMLDALIENFELIIATSKLESAAVHVLERKQLLGYFSGVFGTANNSKESKVDVMTRAIDNRRKSEIIGMVGDRIQDVKAAKAHDLRSIAVSWGYALPGELQSSDPDFIIDAPNELLQLLTSFT